jgi:hypothetical protein
MRGGSRVSPKKDLFPDYMDRRAVHRAITDAYRHITTRIASQGARVKVQGVTNAGNIIEMWVNRETRVIETAYPVGWGYRP